MADSAAGGLTPEREARREIDAQLVACGWVVQDHKSAAVAAARGVAVREVPVGAGRADYVLFVDCQAVGVIEAKPVGMTLTGVESQTLGYRKSYPGELPMFEVGGVLPFGYESTGVETRFTCGLDPVPTSRRVFSFHRPETLARWCEDRVETGVGTLRGGVQLLPDLDPRGLWPAQAEAVRGLESSLRANRPRALIQMTMGAGKTFTAVNAVYRLIRHAGARRVLFLVDRANLGRQAVREFEGFDTPDDGRKFTELYNVRRLTSPHLDMAGEGASKVHVSTIQRLYSLLRGEELDDALDEQSGGDMAPEQPVEVAYSPKVPVESYDVIVVDECHRSIYGVWRGVLEYFAKDDSHADDIVQIVREEFGLGNEAAVKITYRSGDSGQRPEDLLAKFRNSYNPRIAVTVDLIATGTDVKPIECVVFMRRVRSRNYFEQMKGRGVRVIDPDDLRAVTPDATVKDRFVLVDAVGVTDDDLHDTVPLERNRHESFERLLSRIGLGSTEATLRATDRKLDTILRSTLQEVCRGPWPKAQLTDVIKSLKNGIFVSRPSPQPPGSPIYRISAVRPLSLRTDEVRYADPVPDGAGAYKVQTGDILLTRYSGNPSYVGAAAVVPREGAGILHPDKLIRVVADRRRALPEWIAAYLTAGEGRSEIDRRLKTTAGQVGISGSQLKTIQIAVPPLSDQQHMIARIGVVQEAHERIRRQFDAITTEAQALRCSVLTAAFSGRLVPQDPDDEPASVLLERIAAGRPVAPTRRR